MKIKTNDYIFKVGNKISLKKFGTFAKNPYSEKDSDEVLNELQKRIADEQDKLYSLKKNSVLIVLQGMDTAGKDGLIERVLKDVNPQGCFVISFKKPSTVESSHDFLWRSHAHLPAKGEIVVFNRSYYEDIVAPYVHPEYLFPTEQPKEIKHAKKILKDRCADIVHFEEYLSRQGVVIIKIFLNLSKAEQKKRLLARLETPNKNWKFEEADIAERAFWNDYQKAYEFCLHHTNHSEAPWHVIPADDKPMARLIASQIVTERLAKLELEFPQVDAKRQRALKGFASKLKNS